MSELSPFTFRAKCPKCDGDRFSWRFVPTGFHMEHAGEYAGRCPVTLGSKGEHLDLTCDRCNHIIGMQTADADVNE